MNDLHLADLRASGLTDETIEKMDCVSHTGEEIYMSVYGDGDAPTKWQRASGYSIPYRDEHGGVVLTRYRMFWDAKDLEQEPKLPKYLSPKGASNAIYFPPGFFGIWKASDYIVVTEGEKKATKAVQEGFPVVAIAGVEMWADTVARKIEKDNHLGMSHATKVHPDLAKYTHRRKTVVVFDSDASEKIQVREARRRLKDALLFQTTHWCRQLDLPVPEGASDKVGMDDLLLTKEGKMLWERSLKSSLKSETQAMTPLFELPYQKQGNRVYSYFVPNHGKYDEYNLSRIIKEVPREDVHEGVDYKEVSGTRVWLSRVIHSVDGDGKTLYELTYVPHSERTPRTITGDAELISIANAKDDILANLGAKVLPKYKATLEEFLVDCQIYGMKEGRVKKAYGTKRRGWREADDHLEFPAYVMASRIITAEQTLAADNPNNELVPIDSGSDDVLRQSLKVCGDFHEWKAAMNRHVLHSTLPALIMGAGMAGLLRNWCQGSENFIMHLYGESSAGKTTAIKAAASAWGNPKKLIDTWKATTNGLERKAVGRNDMAMFLDEAGMAEESELVAAIYALGNGGEKMRATRDARERSTSKYNVVVLSTGEKQLVRGTKFVGQEVRALELRVDVAGPFWKTINDVQTAEVFGRTLDENYGHAVEPMIRGILSRVRTDKKAVQNMWANRTEDIRRRATTQLPQHIMRRIKHFGLILTSLELFLVHVMEWNELEVTDKMEELSEQIISKMVQLDTDQFQQGERIGILQHFMNQLASCQNKFIQDSRPGNLSPQDLYGSIEGKICYIIPGKLSEMMKPYDNARLIQAAEAQGALMTRQSGKRKTISHRIGNARPDCYVFDLEAMEKALYQKEDSVSEE